MPAGAAPARLVLEDRTWALVLNLRQAAPRAQVKPPNSSASWSREGLQLRRSVECLEAVPEGVGTWKSVLGLLAGLRGALPVYVGAGEMDEEAFALLNRRGAITVHVGEPQRSGTNARWQVADCGEVIRLIHWLADARRRST